MQKPKRHARQGSALPAEPMPLVHRYPDAGITALPEAGQLH
jgi:hypothetical protein